jgi:hypothetical protein
MSYDYQTSYPAYEEAIKKMGEHQRKVYATIDFLGQCTDKEIAAVLGWPINSVTPRRGELVSGGYVVSVGISVDMKTGRKVNKWKIRQE